ncbi:MAG TPA: cytochrome c oxidase accessory protein CcoG [Saprospiraceae bacterium]|nr:cytochrome c oxidase accessory protein CcoG [Saprospiraceae bacterium]HMQ84047.1 cytochrome c oxidase accessory protein CcoG [Saprospiraceae bacterium]
MSTSAPIKDKEQFRDKIATIDEKGKRFWIYPKKPKGKYYNTRSIVSWVLLAFLFGMPFLKVNGEPLLLFNVLERRFILFGIHFAPQDFHLFVLAMLTFMVFIVLFTVVWGRLFCGWVCPQTIFMEMVFRKIEYWIEGDANAQRKLNQSPWTSEKIIKKVGKQAIFFMIAVLVANTFLSYIIGVDEVLQIVQEPISENLRGFMTMILFSAAFYFVFSYMREQVCIAICPYGRMQGVLLDQNSIVVAYDFVRGEPRGKIRKTSAKATTNPLESTMLAVQEAAQSIPATIEESPIKLGDCIDCKLCVQVCPTGIDIRNGTQLECINCTACMDACDEVMEKIGREKKLIRYDSYTGIVEKRKKLFTTRVIAYTAVLAVLIVVNIILLNSRGIMETLLLRTPGMLYQEIEEGYISNLYNYQLINKSGKDMPIEFKLVDQDGRIRLVGQAPTAKANEVVEGALFVDIEKNTLKDRKTRIVVEVYSEGKLIDQVKTNFLGPVK